MDLGEAEIRMQARKDLRRAYVDDVDLLAKEIVARLKRGEFDSRSYHISEIIQGLISAHPRLNDDGLMLETLCYSMNRLAIEKDFIGEVDVCRGMSWYRIAAVDRQDPRELYDFVLPPFQVVAFYAFSRDVNERVVALLGDPPDDYLAARHP